MSKVYKNIVQFFKTHQGKTRGVNLGTAIIDGDRIYLKFDALPIPRKNNFDELTVEASIVERREGGGFNQPEQGQEPGPEPTPGDGDAASDDIPF